MQEIPVLWYALYYGTHYYGEGVYMQSGDNERQIQK